MLANDASDLLIGRSLGEFVLREKLGEGGQGAVYRAEQQRLGREAAVKVVSRSERGAHTVARFLREVSVASLLDHPYAAHIYAFGAESDVLWVAMEYVRGTTLSQLLHTQGSLPLARWVPILERICEVVHTAHEQGIVHRDLKPANVMIVSRAGRLLPKLLDFGISKAMGSEPAPRRQKGDSPLSVAALVRTEETNTLVLEGRPEGTFDTEATGNSLGSVFLANSASLDLTEAAGVAVGSPPYMAPECWTEPGAVGPRSDIYALGVTTYEVLKGRRPFRAPSTMAMMREHLASVIPSLGEGFPVGVDAVVKGALAKTPGGRPATALAFANEMRIAAGAHLESGFAALDPALCEAFITDAPQPIAECLVQLVASRNREQALSAGRLLHRALVRYVSLLCLSAHTQGRGDLELSELQAMGRAGLTDKNWLSLARRVCSSFVRSPELFPVPELVELFFTREGEPQYPFDEVVKVLDAAEDEVLAGELDQLTAVYAALRRLLRALLFLIDYPLGFARGETLELWTGSKRARRQVRFPPGAAGHAGHLLLMGKEGGALLDLWPLFSVDEPTPGAEEEVFLFEGRGRQGLQQISFPGLFERHEEAAQSWLEARFPWLVETQKHSESQDRPPYLGLAPFRPEDASLFYGREREVEAFVNRLRKQPLLGVVGPSGAGKSSFVQAGVVASLHAHWRVVTVRPGIRPLAELCERLAREGLADLTPTLLASRPQELGKALIASAKQRGEVWVLVVDQLEEVFTLCLDQPEREAYARALSHAAQGVDQPLRVVFTLRDDFLVRAEGLEAFRNRLSMGIQLLTTPGRDELLRIVVEPARRAGFEFDDPALPSEMVDAVQEQPGALALLSFTASQLWETRDRHFGRLLRRSYDAMGGVGGALARHAESTVATLSDGERPLLREAFRHLVTSEGTRAVLSRSELLELLGGGESAAQLLEKLIVARLLVSQEAELNQDRVEVIHEALLSAWPRLVVWRREDSESARLRDQLRAAARQWEDRKRPKGLLWRDDALTEYRLWRARYVGALTSSEEAFAQSSEAQARKAQRLRTTLLAGAFIVLAGFSVFLWQASVRARAAQGRAERLLTDSYFDQGRRLMIAGDPMRGLAYLSEAHRLGTRGPAISLLLAEGIGPMAAEERRMIARQGPILESALSPDGQKVATASLSGKVQLWDWRTGHLLRTMDHGSDVFATAFSADGRELVVGGQGGASVWGVESGEKRAFFDAHGERAYTAVFSPDGTRLLIALRSGSAELVDRATGKRLQLFPHPEPVRRAQFSPDGHLVLVEPDLGTRVRLWNADTGKLVAELPIPTAFREATFSPDGSQIATSFGTGGLFIWDAQGHQRMELVGYEAAVQAIAWSPDGTRLVTGGADQTIRVWDARSGHSLLRMAREGGGILYVAFAPDGRRFVASTSHGEVQLWDAEHGVLLGLFAGHAGQAGPVFFAQGERILSSGWDGTVRVWKTVDGVSPRYLSTDVKLARVSPLGDRALLLDHVGGGRLVELTTGKALGVIPPGSEIFRTSWSPDGAHIATARRGASEIELWQSVDGTREHVLQGHQKTTRNLAFSPDSTRLLSTNGDGTARLWDVAHGTMLSVFSGAADGFYGGAFSPDGQLIFATALHHIPDQAEVWVWDARSLRRLSRLPASPWSEDGMQISTNPARVVVADRGGDVGVWDPITGVQIARTHLPSPATALVRSAGDELVALTVDGASPRVLDGHSLQQIGQLDGHALNVNTLALDTTGELGITGSQDETAKIWDIASRRVVRSIPGAWTVAVPKRANGLVVVSAEGTAVYWPLPREERPPEVLSPWIHCRAPFQLEQGSLVTTRTDGCAGFGL